MSEQIIKKDGSFELFERQGLELEERIRLTKTEILKGNHLSYEPQAINNLKSSNIACYFEIADKASYENIIIWAINWYNPIVDMRYSETIAKVKSIGPITKNREQVISLEDVELYSGAFLVGQDVKIYMCDIEASKVIDEALKQHKKLIKDLEKFDKEKIIKSLEL